LNPECGGYAAAQHAGAAASIKLVFIRAHTRCAQRLICSNGDIMDGSDTPQPSGNRRNVESRTETQSENEMKCEVESLRALVCDLLRTNQQLRAALIAASHIQSRHTEPAPPRPSEDS
jgi:hypothetical protein